MKHVSRRTLLGAAAISAPLSIIVIWALGLTGVQVPVEVAMSIATLLAALASAVVGYIVPHVGPIANPPASNNGASP